MILAYILSVILDVHSTCLSLNNGGREILLPFKTCKNIILFEAAVIPSYIIWHNKFEKKHPKLTKGIIIAAIISHSSAAIYNYRRFSK